MRAPAHAATLEIAPVIVEMAGAATTVLTVTNRGNDLAAVQIRGFAWSQTGNEDKLDKTDALTVSPSIFQIPAGGSQTIRILLRQPPKDRETSYRLILDELPPASDGQAVRFALRISVPIFASPPTPVPAKPDFHIALDAEGNASLVIGNTGGRRVRLVNAVVSLPDGASAKAEPPANPYVLPDAERHWTLGPPAEGQKAPIFKAGQTATLTADSDSGPVREVIRIAGAP
ncbi:MAG: fimbria/pilus periplasmic chaperone [Azospirillaceae bacterium]|nr:fimbria/pilus periplasmic chaperone [Azospirillaceae bacterium]